MKCYKCQNELIEKVSVVKYLVSCYCPNCRENYVINTKKGERYAREEKKLSYKKFIGKAR
jgi:hypothetical protein